MRKSQKSYRRDSLRGRERYGLALLVSLMIHLALFSLAHRWLEMREPLVPPKQPLSATLVLSAPPTPMEEMPELKNTMEDDVRPVVPPPAAVAPMRPTEKSPAPSTPAQALQGPALERAQTRLSDQLLYPPDALEQGIQGEVIVLIKLDAHAGIVDVSVASSSGSQSLDEAALRAVRNLRRIHGAGAAKILFPVRFEIR
jgi:protein TonB